MLERRYFRGGHRNFVVHDGGDIAGYFHRYEPLRTESSLYPGRTIDVFLPRKNALHIPLTYHTAMKSTPMTAFIDCGATECFISQEFIDEHKLGMHKLHDPRLLQNADGSANMGGNITDYADLEITTGNKVAVL